MKRVSVKDPFGVEWNFTADFWLLEDTSKNFTVLYRFPPDGFVMLKTFEKADGFLWKEIINE